MVKDNFTIVNTVKVQEMVIERFGKLENKHEMYIDNKKIRLEHSVKLLGIDEIDNQLNFDNNFKFYLLSCSLTLSFHDVYK